MDDPVRGWETWLDRFVAALPDKVFVELFGVNCECKVSGDGMGLNGHYLELETTSVPEGIPVKFALFDDDIMHELISNVERSYRNLHTYEMHSVICFDASPEAAQFLRDDFAWEVAKDYGEWDYTLAYADIGYSPRAIIEYLETCWHSA